MRVIDLVGIGTPQFGKLKLRDTAHERDTSCNSFVHKAESRRIAGLNFELSRRLHRELSLRPRRPGSAFVVQSRTSRVRF